MLKASKPVTCTNAGMINFPRPTGARDQGTGQQTCRPATSSDDGSQAVAPTSGRCSRTSAPPDQALHPRARASCAFPGAATPIPATGEAKRPPVRVPGTLPCFRPPGIGKHHGHTADQQPAKARGHAIWGTRNEQTFGNRRRGPLVPQHQRASGLHATVNRPSEPPGVSSAHLA